MSKILIYVDAENVSQAQVLSALSEAKDLADNDDIIIGKFYGVKETLGAIVDNYIKLGFEFIDTGIYTDNHKNTTDMKLITDCLWEVVSIYQGDIKAIYILSNDRDFNPLIAKLKGFNFILNVASASIFGDLNSIDGLTRALQIRKFLPVKKDILFVCIYESIVNCLRDVEVEEFIILEYLKERIGKLHLAVETLYGIKLDCITEEYLKKFCFNRFNAAMISHGQNNLEINVKLFTTKLFGVFLSKKDMMELLTTLKE